jgi:hypothetical protein
VYEELAVSMENLQALGRNKFRAVVKGTQSYFQTFHDPVRVACTNTCPSEVNGLLLKV